MPEELYCGYLEPCSLANIADYSHIQRVVTVRLGCPGSADRFNYSEITSKALQTTVSAVSQGISSG
jgi:hypothetical protein